MRRSELYYTASGIITHCRWPSGAQDGHLQVWRYQILYNTVLTSWWWSQQWSKHVEAYNKSYYKTRICALSWLITKIYSTCSIRLLVQWLKLSLVNRTQRIGVYVFCLAVTTSETLCCNKTEQWKSPVCVAFSKIMAVHKVDFVPSAWRMWKVVGVIAVRRTNMTVSAVAWTVLPATTWCRALPMIIEQSCKNLREYWVT